NAPPLRATSMHSSHWDEHSPQEQESQRTRERRHRGSGKLLRPEMPKPKTIWASPMNWALDLRKIPPALLNYSNPQQNRDVQKHKLILHPHSTAALGFHKATSLRANGT